GKTLAINSVSTGVAEMSLFHGLSLGKIRQPAYIVPGPGTPPLLETAGPPGAGLPELVAGPELPELEPLAPPFASSSPQAMRATIAHAEVTTAHRAAPISQRSLGRLRAECRSPRSC